MDLAREQELDPDWAPDGETILFEVFGGSEHGFAILRLADGTQPGSSRPPTGDFAHWSPDGRAIVYHSARRTPAAAARQRRRTRWSSRMRRTVREAFYAAWSPDGGRIYYLTRSAEGLDDSRGPADRRRQHACW